MNVLLANPNNLRKLYISQLQILLSTEQQIIEVMPTMIESATDTQLKQVLQSHLQETEVQVLRIEQILREATGEATSTKCKVLAALIDEAEDMVKDAPDELVRDAALIASAQRVERYEIAAYAAVRGFAQILGETSQAELLDETIQEEGHADHLLSRIASRVNLYARRAA